MFILMVMIMKKQQVKKQPINLNVMNHYTGHVTTVLVLINLTYVMVQVTMVMKLIEHQTVQIILMNM